MPAGRPVEYNASFLTKAQEYLDSCVGKYEVLTRPIIVNIYEDDKDDDDEEDEELEDGNKGKISFRYRRIIIGQKVEEEKYTKWNPNLPTKGGLAVYIGVSRDTLYDWAEKYPEFSDIMEKLGAMQEGELINKGLSGDYNPTISKVLLTKHGYREGHELTGSEGKDLIPDKQSQEKADKAIDSFLTKKITTKGNDKA